MGSNLPDLESERYELLEPIGRGGMATVYRAFDRWLQVPRAIKVLEPRLNRSEVLQERFRIEARTMARLEHSNIVAVQDVGSWKHGAYIVMELVDGGSLMEHVLRYGPMPHWIATETVLELLDAVQLAHDRGVIHRDIKPQNILTTRAGQIKIADFGIARVIGVSTDRSLTLTGATIGTWGYMAPEQRSNSRKVGVQVDIYSVGATLYTLLTGEIPTDLFAAEVDDAVLARIEPRLVDAIRKATRYHPEDRYQSAAEMGSALEEVLGELSRLPDSYPELGSCWDMERLAPTDLDGQEGSFEEPPRRDDDALDPAADALDPAADAPASRSLPWSVLVAGLGLMALAGIGLWVGSQGAAGSPDSPVGSDGRGSDVAEQAVVEPSTASVSFYGDAEAVELRGDGGGWSLPGEVPPGRYTIVATFDASETDAGTITVAPGTHVELKCFSEHGRCTSPLN